MTDAEAIAAFERFARYWSRATWRELTYALALSAIASAFRAHEFLFYCFIGLALANVALGVYAWRMHLDAVRCLRRLQGECHREP